MPKTDLDAIRANYEYFRKAVRSIRYGDTDSLRKVSTTLGYQVAYATPGLLEAVDQAEGRLTAANREIDRLHSKLEKEEETN